MIRHRFTFQQVYVLLTTKIPQYVANLFTKTSIQGLLSIFWHDHYVVLTIPFDMGLTLPIFHNGSPGPNGTFLRRTYTINTPETAEP
jgi:hypothetical protein